GGRHGGRARRQRAPDAAAALADRPGAPRALARRRGRGAGARRRGHRRGGRGRGHDGRPRRAPRRGGSGGRRARARPPAAEPRRRLLHPHRPRPPRRREPGRGGGLMLAALGAAIAKDLRLLARDRAGLVFLALAPVVVITVAGFSLAGLFGAPPGGSRAYLLPVADEDGGRLGRALRAGLADAPALEMRRVADEEAARALVRGGTAGVALVLPPG